MTDNTPYLILGLVVAFGILATFIASMAIRHHNLQKDIEVLKYLGDDQQ